MINIAEEAAKRGGAVLREHFGRASLSIERKAASDFVTDVDRRSEEAIQGFLAAETPGYGFLLEEGGVRDAGAEYRWIVDPLDGTTNFIHRYPFFSVSLALVHGETVLAGVVYDPLRNEMFSSEGDGATRLNGVPMTVSRTADLGDALLCTGFPFRHKRWLDAYLASFRELFLRSAGIRRDGSAALDLAYVAAGRFEAFWELGLMPWDVAAGSLLVANAGGRVSDFHGGDDAVFAGDVIASNGHLHEPILAVTRAVFAAGRPRRE